MELKGNYSISPSPWLLLWHLNFVPLDLNIGNSRPHPVNQIPPDSTIFNKDLAQLWWSTDFEFIKPKEPRRLVWELGPCREASERRVPGRLPLGQGTE
jgi:hypothetical protein